MKPGVITRRRATNVTLPDELVGRARELDVNLSKACEAGLAAAVKDAARSRWKADNTEWIQAHRQWVEENDLPLEKYRLF
jgi:antitoxin CcdA